MLGMLRFLGQELTFQTFRLYFVKTEPVVNVYISVSAHCSCSKLPGHDGLTLFYILVPPKNHFLLSFSGILCPIGNEDKVEHSNALFEKREKKSSDSLNFSTAVNLFGDFNESS